MTAHTLVPAAHLSVGRVAVRGNRMIVIRALRPVEMTYRGGRSRALEISGYDAKNRQPYRAVVPLNQPWRQW